MASHPFDGVYFTAVRSVKDQLYVKLQTNGLNSLCTMNTKVVNDYESPLAMISESIPDTTKEVNEVVLIEGFSSGQCLNDFSFRVDGCDYSYCLEGNSVSGLD